MNGPATETSPGFSVEIHMGGKAVFLLDRPKLNFLSTKMCRRLIGKLTAYRDNDGVKGIILASEGRMFCAGAEVSEHLEPHVELMIEAFSELCYLLATYPKPVVALVHRVAGGGGLELARSCQLVYTWNRKNERGISFSLPEIKLRCFPPIAAAMFPQLTPETADIIRFIMTGQTLNLGDDNQFAKAKELGLVDDEFEGTLEQLITSLDFAALAKVKNINDRFGELNITITGEVVAKALSDSFDDVCDFSTDVLHLTDVALVECSEQLTLRSALEHAKEIYLEQLIHNPAYIEGITAFLEKRPAKITQTGF